MRKYEKYKDSGVLWINNIPEEWRLSKVKYNFRIGRGRVIATTEVYERGEYPVYSSQTTNNGCIGYIDTYDFDKEQLTWTTDGANAGTVFLRDGKYNCTNVCGILSPLDIQMSIRFMLYTLEYIAIYHKRPDTNGYKIMNNEMAKIEIPIPPIDEQNNIAKFIDNRISTIDKIINDKQNLIEKLKEYSQAIINEAVTKGLDKNDSMKDSGVDWIGEIPEGWNINKFKYLFTFSRGLNITKADLIEDGIPCVNYGEIHSKFGFEINPAFNNLTFVDKNYIESSPKSILARGDFIFADTSEDIEGSGNFTCLNSDIPTFAGYHTIVARQKENHNYRYLSYLFESSKYRNQIRSSVYGVKVYSITQNILKNTMVMLPPKKEQERIACFLDKSRNKINSTINSTEQQIAKLQEYKKSVISEAVTGKIKVD